MLRSCASAFDIPVISMLYYCMIRKISGEFCIVTEIKCPLLDEIVVPIRCIGVNMVPFQAFAQTLVQEADPWADYRSDFDHGQPERLYRTVRDYMMDLRYGD